MKEQVSSIDLTSEQLHLVRELLREHIPHAKVWAYGSRVKWTSMPKSDLDLVAHVSKETKGQICALREAFEESSLPFRVDLFIWDEVPEEFHAQIESGYFTMQNKGQSPLHGQLRLSDISDLVKEKTPVSLLSINNYISTENLLPNKGGKTVSMGLPNVTKTQSYQKGDVLVSNIRPYFKKIWYATSDGGCSNDVLVFRAKKNYSSHFLYYVLLDDSFFDYTTKNSDGTKMPRGNKKAINNYKVPVFDVQTQKQIAHVLSTIDKKIELNQRINENLEQQAQAIFCFMFANDIIKSVGKNCVELSSLIDIIDNRGKTPPIANTATKFPIIDVRSLSGQTRVINYSNCTKYVEIATYNDWFRKGHPQPLDILMSTVGSVAEIKLFYGKIGCIAQNVIGMRSKEISPYYLYQYLQYIKPILVSYNIGSVQPSIKVTHIIKQLIYLPEQNNLEKYHNISKILSDNIYKNHIKNIKLIQLRDTLLPKLMSGEIDVSQVKL